MDGAHGADELATLYAQKNNINYTVRYANWDKYGKAAGAVRNKEMLTLDNPDCIIAFTGGKGTAHMVEIATKAGIEVIDYRTSCS